MALNNAKRTIQLALHNGYSKNTLYMYPKILVREYSHGTITQGDKMSLILWKHHLLFKNLDIRLFKNFSVLSGTVFRGLKNKSPEDNDVEKSSSYLFVPVNYKPSAMEESLGEEMVGPLKKEEILSVIHRFYSDDEIKAIADEQGLDRYLYQQTIISFRKLCSDPKSIPTELHIVINDVLKGASHIHDLYPYFFKHAQSIFPHLSCLDELYKVSDLTQPPNWYPEARTINRKIIFHAGPTNSGKTYQAMARFLSAKSGVYCSPLKLLAVEVFQKSNKHGTPCDLITGEERKYVVSEDSPSNHVACTIEMTSLQAHYDVAIIDEVQMIRDATRGWAWTRAFFGLCAKEIHICGEASSISIIKELALSIGEDVEVRRYERLTKFTIEDTALSSLDMVQDGDCVVCFSKQQIHKVAQTIERLGREVAVIYGVLPPGVKLAQAQKFNDPNHPCKIMVATDAIGMGLNLSIRRIIFNSLVKPSVNEKGEKEIDTLSVSQALQIAGRAGRYGSVYEEGFVTTLHAADLPLLKKLLMQQPAVIEQAGLHPTAEQIELFAFHLPDYALSKLIDIFVRLCTVDSSLYYMCVMEDFKFLADMIQHVPLSLRAQYTFCCAPINRKMTFVCAMFLKFARKYSLYEPVTLQWLCEQIKWPFSSPKTIHELVHLEEAFDVFDLYLWLSYRFSDMFPDAEMVRSLQAELDATIEVGVSNITQLLRNTEMSTRQKLEEERVEEKTAASLNGSDLRSSSSDLVEELGSDLRSSSSDLVESLSNRLLRKGIISHKMLQELQAEWKDETTNDKAHRRDKVPRRDSVERKSNEDSRASRKTRDVSAEHYSRKAASLEKKSNKDSHVSRKTYDGSAKNDSRRDASLEKKSKKFSHVSRATHGRKSREDCSRIKGQ